MALTDEDTKLYDIFLERELIQESGEPWPEDDVPDIFMEQSSTTTSLYFDNGEKLVVNHV